MVTKKQIKSDSDPSNTKPWYDVQIDNGLPKVADHADADVPDNAGLAGSEAKSPSWSSASGPPAKSMQQDVIYAVTESGEFVAYTDQDEDVPPLLAHLAWYDNSTDEFTVLEFVEE